MLAERHLRRFLSGVLLLLLLATTARAQTTYTSIQNVSSFGWLDQYSLNTLQYNFVGAEACVPTSSVNTMTYLQNVAPSYFGTNLTGLTYADWIDADTTLIAPGYMDTSPVTGTAYNHLHFGLNKYVVQDLGFTEVQFSGMIPSFVWDNPGAPPPEPRPATIADSLPTWNFLYESLISGSGTVLGLTYTSLSGGHAVSLGGFDWTDLNGNGRVDFEENAQLYFVDPLDPTRGTDPNGGAQFTTGQIWEVEVPDPTNATVVYTTLELAYEQYAGNDLWGGCFGWFHGLRTGVRLPHDRRCHDRPRTEHLRAARHLGRRLGWLRPARPAPIKRAKFWRPAKSLTSSDSGAGTVEVCRVEILRQAVQRWSA